MPFSHHFIDTCIAPELSKIESPRIKPLSGYEDLMHAYVLNFTFRFRPEPKNYAYGINYLSRVHEAAMQYEMGAEALKRFLPQKNEDPPQYYIVMHRFESCIAMAWQANCLMQAMWRSMTQESSTPYDFSKGDGSIAERVNALYNTSKHCEKRIENGDIPENGTVALWLTNEGIRSKQSFLSYDDLHAFLVALIEHANFLAVKLPEMLAARGPILADAPAAGDVAQDGP